MAMRPALAGSSSMWWWLGVPYSGLTLIALWWLQRTQQLRGLLRFRSGDPSLGVAVGGLLLAGAWVFREVLLAEASPQRAWLAWLFAQLGDASRPGVAVALLCMVACEELVWRGWVQSELRQVLGARRGWIATSVAYGLAHAATVFSLSDAVAGPNPLLVLAALGAGLAFGFLAERTQRLLPSLFAHAVFTYFGADYLRAF